MELNKVAKARQIKLIGERLRTERMQRAWSQKRVTDEINRLYLEDFPDARPVSVAWFDAMEHCRGTHVNTIRLTYAARVFGIAVGQLLNPKDSQRQENMRHRLHRAFDTFGLPLFITHELEELLVEIIQEEATRICQGGAIEEVEVEPTASEVPDEDSEEDSEASPKDLPTDPPSSGPSVSQFSKKILKAEKAREMKQRVLSGEFKVY